MNPHLLQPVSLHGCPPDRARLAGILVHGRGRDAAEMLEVADRLALPDVSWTAPQAADNSWYPQPFMRALELNQPWLDQALERIDTLLAELARRGFAAERVVLLGFSQGACLVSEYVARHPRRYAALVAFTGGLIGPPGTQWNRSGDLAGTPVLLATSDADEWVPLSRVQETAAAFRRLGAQVTLDVQPGLAHVISDAEIARARSLIEAAGR